MEGNGPERIPDRRLSARVQVVGTAIVLTADRYVGTFLVENVSATGALLAGDSQLAVGDDVRVLLQIHGSPRIGLHGEITRRAERNGQHLFALSFQATPATQDFLQRAAPTSSPLVLVVEENIETCAALTAELGLMGRSAMGVHSPVDAIGWLHAPGLDVEAIAVGAAFAEMDGLDLLNFIALDFPKVRRVLVVPGESSVQAAAEPAQCLLKDPWDREALEKAFLVEEP
jgi:hypothetical protein